MIEAAARGGELAQRASEEVVRERQAAAESIERGVSQVAGMFHDRETREADRAFQEKEAMRDRAHRAELQAQETGSRERIAGAELARRKEELEAENVHRGIQRVAPNGQQQDGPVQRSPGPEAQPQQQKPVGEGKGAFDPRAQKLQEEMQRGAAQMGKPIEMTPYGDNKFAPSFEQTPDRKAAEQAKIAKEESLALQRINRQQMAIEKHNLADWKADNEARAEAKKALSDQLGIAQDQKLISDAATGKMSIEGSEWGALQRDFGDNPDPGIQQELAAKQFGPSLRRAVSNRIVVSGIRMAAAIGEVPEGVDISNPLWQKFVQTGPLAAQAIIDSQSEPLLGIRDYMDKVRILNKIAANRLLVQQQQEMMQAQAREAGRMSVPQRPQTRASVPNRSPAPQQQQQQQPAYRGAGALGNK